jgi:DNA-binding transcriptional LysR family regulator
MWIVLPDNRSIPPKVRAFVDFVAEAMRGRAGEFAGLPTEAGMSV